MFDDCRSLLIEIGGFGCFQGGGWFSNGMGMGELRNSIDENLFWRCTKAERVGVPNNDV